MNDKTYLGDAVYARFDGELIVLTTEDGISATNTIYIDSEVLAELIKFVKKIQSEGHIE